MTASPGTVETTSKYCPACTPKAIQLDEDERLWWMTTFSTYEHTDCQFQHPLGLTLAAARFGWLLLQAARGRQVCKPMPNDPQPEFWPSYKPKREFTGDSIIERIKGAYRLEDIAGRLTRLYGTGNMLSGRCPLHGEKSGRAFTVWVDTQKWKCFGKCLDGGDVIDLVQACMDRGIEWRERST